MANESRKIQVFTASTPTVKETGDEYSDVVSVVGDVYRVVIKTGEKNELAVSINSSGQIVLTTYGRPLQTSLPQNMVLEFMS